MIQLINKESYQIPRLIPTNSFDPKLLLRYSQMQLLLL